MMGGGSIILFSEEEEGDEEGKEEEETLKNEDLWMLFLPDAVCRSHSRSSRCSRKC